MPFVVMIAGPNGSGKTTLTNHIRQAGVDLGRYINPDEIAATLTGSHESRVRSAQRLADEARDQCLAEGLSFTFETVMSHRSKVDIFAKAAILGFEPILYYVATADPALNVARVAQRVALGGHDVPTDKILHRYESSLALLPYALVIAKRAYVFDNSDHRGLRLGLTKGRVGTSLLDIMEDVPHWIVTSALTAAELQSNPGEGNSDSGYSANVPWK